MQPDSLEAVHAELERLQPAELLVPETLAPPPWLRDRPGVRSRPPWHFELDTAQRLLCRQFGTRDLAGFGCETLPAAIRAAGCLLQYVHDTQRSAVPHLRGLITERRDETLILDAATRRNLEIETSLAGRPEHTLAGLLDRHATPMGSRLLRRWLQRPLRDRQVRELRLHAIAALIDGGLFEPLHEQLRGSGDVERILARVALRSARPRDLALLRDALLRLPGLLATLQTVDSPRLGALAAACDPHPEVAARLEAALVEAPPVLIRDGGVIAGGFDAELDELRALGENAEQYLLDLETRERERTGLNTLKVGYNRVHGYYSTPQETSTDALARLTAYHWPGNVRELKHTLLRAAIMNRGSPCVERLPDDFERLPAWASSADALMPGMSIREVERSLIEKTLEHFAGNRKMTAEALGVSLKTLYNRLKDYEGSSPEE